jgi:hypothetical protein
MERPQENDYIDHDNGYFDSDAYEKDLNAFIDQLEKENEELKILLRQSTSVYKTDSENDLKWEEKRNKILKNKTE